jgi:hypothetical protein
MPNIDFTNYPLNSSEKTEEGFDENILKDIQIILSECISAQMEPRLAHLVVQSPNELIFERLGAEIRRWFTQRKPSCSSKPLWIAVHEQSTSRGFHLHLAVIADGISYVDLQILSERLSKFSKKGKARLLKRKRVFLTDSHGVILKNEDGGLIRKGHSHFHTLKTELADGYERLSYFAKSMTKRLIPNRKKCYLVCRLSNALAALRPELQANSEQAIKL